MRGASAAELLVALLLVLIVAGGLGHAVIDAQASLRAQPASNDLMLRARAVLTTIAEDVAAAGAGPPLVDAAAPLLAWVPALLPRRVGAAGSDPDTAAFADRLTAIAIPDGAPQAPVESTLAPDLVALRFGPWCPVADIACGFRPGRWVLLFDRQGQLAIAEVAAPEPGALRLDRALSGSFGPPEDAHAGVLQIASYSYDPARRQLRRGGAAGVDVPVLDDVVAFSVRFFGDPLPPLEPHVAGAATCATDAAGLPTLPVLTPDTGTLVELTPAMLSDGPWCGVAPERFDADLYRIRRVRISLRLQADVASARGRDPSRFALPGTAVDEAAMVADFEMHLDVAPRNLKVL